jgi:formyl-CoA transferase
VDKRAFYRHARDDLTGPLDGVRVLDVTTAWAGPMAASMLGDLGADVIRVEMPGNRDGQMPPEIGDTELSWFRQTVNRNKRSVGLDLREEASRPLFLELVGESDILVENFRPGTLASWGLGYDDCRAIRPDIVYVSISAYGQFPNGSDRPGYDPVVQAESGWMSLNGDADGGPVKGPTFLADDLAAVHAAMGALAALRHRDRTGEGQHVDVALLDVLLFQSTGFLTLAASGTALPRWGNETDAICPSNVYRCRDGHVFVTVALNRHWRALAEAIDRPELARAPGYATNEERRSNRDAVNGAIASWASTTTVQGAVDLLRQRGISAAPVRTFAETAADAHVWERDMLQPTLLSNGSVAPLTGPAVKFSRTPTRVRAPAPIPGAHTAEILAVSSGRAGERTPEPR